MRAALAITLPLAVAAGAVAAGACGEDEVLPIERLQDPATCLECHPKHYQQWSGSMHAYASEDPVFLAMNARGQRETNGALGDFCVRCHAPMAVELGLTDGRDFDPEALPPQARGITCYFCHNVAQVTSTHNNGLVLANDQTMRGGVRDPIRNSAHRSAYDPLMDSDRNESEICGSCHDIVTQRGVAIERTYAEWQTTFFAKRKEPEIHLTCGGCHMGSSRDVIADAPGLAVPVRANGFHDHMWPGIDQALTPFPEYEAQAQAIKDILDPSITIVGATPLAGGPPAGGICVTPLAGGQVTVRIDSIGTGHAWPSGSAMDRRSWLELVAYDANDAVVFQSGVVPDGVDPEDLGDPNLLGLWDRVFKDDGTPAHFFWEIATVDSQLLPPPTTLDPLDPNFDHSITHRFPVGALHAQIARITARVLIRPLPFSLLRALEASGDLAPEIAGRLQTLEVGGTVRTWTRALANSVDGCARN